MKKVELLAPAGNYEALKGAIMAGADAVYLGGQMFGARAYADNFNEEEICKGIRFAHIYGRKIYLTVNTLIKEKEFKSLYQYILPFYQAGLDGIIIQDLGVLKYVRETFPGLELHISTQMAVTGAHGAEFVKKAGACRIVPARELSLNEIREMKQRVSSIEIETFIHGALCYCYSGQCLFSSIIGQRSGNRGRCAQPCRLPFSIGQGKECYPLSMKDMCTIEILPELIEAGIDSFKVEGRMKRPEYAAGVTAIYRKYIDLYYSNKPYNVEPNDMSQLNSLYIRSAVGRGYYHVNNGKEMITNDLPGYSGNNEQLLDKIRETYIDTKSHIPINASLEMFIGKPASLTLSWRDITITVQGDAVQQAQKQPLTVAKMKEQISKSGNTYFVIDEVITNTDSDIFIPVSSLNQLRREAITMLEDAMIEYNGLEYHERKQYQKINHDDFSKHKLLSHRASAAKENRNMEFASNKGIHVMISNKEQLNAILKEGADRIYIDCFLPDKNLMQDLLTYKKEHKIQVYLAMPYIIRKRDNPKLEELYEGISQPVFDGVLVRNLEAVSYLKKKGYQKHLVTDCGLYIFNKETYHFWREKADEVYLPLECNGREWDDTLKGLDIGTTDVSAMIYGRIPMMISANCIRKTTGKCSKQNGYIPLTDRLGKQFPVYTDCVYCYNIIYNTVPLSLHKAIHNMNSLVSNYRLDFTMEMGHEAAEIVRYFKDVKDGKAVDREPCYKEYTTGHFKRGAE